MIWMGGAYIKMDSNLFSKGKIITTCEQNNCFPNEKLPNIVNDWKNTFYKGEIISWFEYNNFIVLDEVNSVFTDKRKVYIYSMKGTTRYGLDNIFSPKTIFTRI